MSQTVWTASTGHARKDSTERQLGAQRQRHAGVRRNAQEAEPHAPHARARYSHLAATPFTHHVREPQMEMPRQRAARAEMLPDMQHCVTTCSRRSQDPPYYYRKLADAHESARGDHWHGFVGYARDEHRTEAHAPRARRAAPADRSASPPPRRRSALVRRGGAAFGCGSGE